MLKVENDKAEERDVQRGERGRCTEKVEQVGCVGK